MENEKLTKFKELLSKELTVVENELRSVGRVNPTNPKDWEPVPDKMDTLAADSNEVADTIESYEENSAILKQLEIRLNEIKEALKKIDNGSYGKCRICDALIDEKRLEANPAANTCQAHM
ncbi:MAG: TraR/DksA C4-type zinc finger protein [Candidatus Uhrbacteria bacterium]|nr:TraR/DksA C4-type zinc finger protein [Candidatus Uhrbacteria bacterium]